MRYMMIERIMHYYNKHGNYDIFEKPLAEWRASKNPEETKNWYRVLDTLLEKVGY